MEIVVAILVFFGVVIVSVLFFGGWVIVAIVRLLARALGGPAAHAHPHATAYPPGRVPPARLPPPQRMICAHGNCRAPNAAAARFCRRCGRPVARAAGGRPAPVVRRVAMW